MPGRLKAGTDVASENGLSVKPPVAVLGEVEGGPSCFTTVVALPKSQVRAVRRGGISQWKCLGDRGGRAGWKESTLLAGGA